MPSPARFLPLRTPCRRTKYSLTDAGCSRQHNLEVHLIQRWYVGVTRRKDVTATAIGPATALLTPNEPTAHALRPKGRKEDSPRRPDVAAVAVSLAVPLSIPNDPTAHASRPECSQDDSPHQRDVAAVALKINKTIGPATVLLTSKGSNVMP